MSEFYQGFIRALRRKYSSALTPSNSPEDAFSGKEPGSGKFSRTTGLGMDSKLNENEPAGIVHEGEGVVPAPVMRNMGGQKGLDKALAKAQVSTGKMPTEGAFVPRGNMPQKELRDLPGYKTGTSLGSSISNVNNNVNDEPAFDMGTINNSIKTTSAFTRTDNSTTPKTTNIPEGYEQLPSGNIVKTGEEVKVEELKLPGPNHSTTLFGADGNVTGTEKTVDGVTTKTGSFKEPEKVKVADIKIPEQRVYEPTELETPDIQERGESQESIDAAKNLEAVRTEIENIAAGNGEASAVQRDIAMGKLAGQLSAQNQAALQQVGQANLTGGALNAFLANQQRNTNIAMTGLNRDLAIDAVNRAENATYKLAEMATNDRAFEEAKRQWGSGFDLTKAQFGLDTAKFNEFNKQFAANYGLEFDKLGVDIQKANVLNEQWENQFGLALEQFSHNVEMDGIDVAIRKMMTDHTLNSWKATALLNLDTADGYRAAGEIYKQMGIDIDMTTLVDSANSNEFARNVADALDALELVPSNYDWTTENDDGTVTFNEDMYNQPAVDSLINAYNNLNGTSFTASTIQNDPKAKQWLEQTVLKTTTKQSWAMDATKAMAPEEIQSLFMEIPKINENGDMVDENDKVVTDLNDAAKKYPDVESFTWAGETGYEAMELAVANMMLTGGISSTLDNTASTSSNPIYQALWGNGPTSASTTTTTVDADGNTVTPPKLVTISDEFKEYYDGLENPPSGMKQQEFANLAGGSVEEAKKILADPNYKTYKELGAELTDKVTYENLNEYAKQLAQTSDKTAEQSMKDAINIWKTYPEDKAERSAFIGENYVDKGINPPAQLVLDSFNSIPLRGSEETGGLNIYDGNPKKFNETGNPGNWVNVEGNAVQLIGDVERYPKRYVILKYNGETYSYSNKEDEWIQGDFSDTKLKYKDATILDKPPWELPAKSDTEKLVDRAKLNGTKKGAEQIDINPGGTLIA